MRRRKREAPASPSAIEAVAVAVRSDTFAFLRTSKRTRLQAIRDQLPEEDRALLILRVDRKLEWNELAHVLAEGAGSETLDAVAVAREAARLRKRFQLVKDRLREMARRAGLTA
jgi:RNA polymerase sigma-70 factor (ECF subfamily)